MGVFAKRVGVTVHTLQRWDREGRLKAGRAVNNRRYYTDNDLAIALGQQKLETKKRCVAYCRVSGAAQNQTLPTNVRHLNNFALPVALLLMWIEEVGGGLNFNRKRFFHD